MKINIYNLFCQNLLCPFKTWIICNFCSKYLTGLMCCLCCIWATSGIEYFPLVVLIFLLLFISTLELNPFLYGVGRKCRNWSNTHFIPAFNNLTKLISSSFSAESFMMLMMLATSFLFHVIRPRQHCKVQMLMVVTHPHFHRWQLEHLLHPLIAFQTKPSSKPV